MLTETQLSLAFLPNFTGWEVLIVLVAILLFFGPKRLPELTRSIAKSIREFKKASNEAEKTFKDAMDEEPKTEDKQVTGTPAAPEAKEEPKAPAEKTQA